MSPVPFDPSDYSGSSRASSQPTTPGVRIGDAEREGALSLLAVHFADGRLTITEYDDRCKDAAAAATRGQLDVLFTDLPPLPDQQARLSGNTGGNSRELAVYSANEIAEQHRRGSRPRAGIMGLTIVGAIAGTAIFTSWPILFLIPAVAILLYVMKIGPESWHTPSPAALERERVKRLRREHQLELEEKAHAEQLANEERKAQRRQKQSEMGEEAWDLAQRAMKGASNMFTNRGGRGDGTSGPSGKHSK
ncbi:MAG TPA: DUF1707 domain-containing protein [Candidatus Corynebacterium avicola]|uniref:DUF1707 domain-containing protein n=1 Tax=Candidatus Corynebacterium avicola TaxID=2838527 RepID=A0A9D1RLX7_9CORY|nr:DUF1707 domain-containing protein [Candidatus Corynebacterium avicola]